MTGYKELLVGLVLALVGIGLLVIPQISFFREAVLTVILGVIPLIVLLVGVMFLMIGVSTMRERGAEMEESEAESESKEE
ncbi:MAG: hypothetical protein IBX41_01375 [Methanophagales archaeon]|nr:hypothetical protein [Methanophagales archaeon]